MKEFRLPDPGEGLVEAEIISWRVAVGDEVAVNDVLLEIETSKSLVELPSPYAGKVKALLAEQGQIVEVGSPIIQIDDGGSGEVEVVQGAVMDATAPTDSPEPEPAPATSGAMLVGYGAKSGSVSRRPRKGVAAQVTGSGPQADQVHDSYGKDAPVSRRVDEVRPGGRVEAAPQGDPLPSPGREPSHGVVPRPQLAKPPVRKLARDLGVNLDRVNPTGPGGVITRADVEAAAASRNTVLADDSGDRRIPLRGVRRAMAQSMTESIKVPQATAWMTVDVTETMALVEALRARREFTGLRISPLLVFAKASCLAIARNPDINSSLDEAAGEIVQHGDVNLGIAAATPRGLMVPNIKRADKMNLLELAQALNQMVAVAKEGRIQPADMKRGTFTITNVGIFGVDAGTPILNPGEAAILCLGTISRKPWVIGTGADERIEPRWVCTLCLTFDHRLVDGEMGSKFLADVATILTDPGLGLLF